MAKNIYIIESGMVDGLKAYSSLSKACNFIYSELTNEERFSFPQFKTIKNEIDLNNVFAYDSAYYHTVIHKKKLN